MCNLIEEGLKGGGIGIGTGTNAHQIVSCYLSLSEVTLGFIYFFVCFFIWVRGGYFSFFNFLSSVSIVLFIFISVVDADALYIYVCMHICM